ncbi:hypothetical protein [Kordiimonas sp. SCSIO 12610]|uniref:hypothetical protein n=1 Tax=Kordiimonas sp. SCSIO 12610 TaxID=2829597 RepID=UPI00210BC2A1|nr:hypothetical protein [Kordiimonas sp. SCSIO 12610]UTW55972.1 hypothetical protein KFF44_03515 [Kordiimonas sp. SCSIO 12610]
MKLVKFAALAATVFALGACSIRVDEGNGRYRHHSDSWNGDAVTASLPNGNSVSFGCPSNMTAFVVTSDDEGQAIYGCRTSNVPVPEVKK